MKQHNRHQQQQQYDRRNYRQSMSILSSELIRHSFNGDSPLPNIYRQSVGTSYRSRNSLNIQMAEHLLRSLDQEKKNKQKQQMSNLKTTLSELQKKINKAKKKLNTFTNIISEESDDEAEQNIFSTPVTPNKYEDATTIGSSLSKICLQTTQPAQFHKIKHYYLNHLASAIQGSNKRAMDHLKISLKVLKNYYKIESPTFADLEQKKVVLPRHKHDDNKKTLLIDIDETILHCQEDPSKPYDLALPIQIENGSTANAYITIRPYAISFLKRMAKHYEIIAFTASHQSYADVVLDELDPQRQYIRHRLYRKNCIQIHENIYAKDLRIINRDLNQMVLIDNAPYSYIFQLENGIPILPFYSGQDNELVHLQKYLEEMARCQDVRELNKSRFKLHKYCNYSELDDMIRSLYLEEGVGK